MANTACTNITFFSSMKEPVEKLHDFISQTMEKPFPAGISDPQWVGRLGIALSLPKSVFNGGSFLRFIDDEISFQEENNLFYFEIELEDKWEKHTEMWDEILTQFPDICYDYICVEPAGQCFINSDREGVFYKNRYAIVGSKNGDTIDMYDDLATEKDMVFYVNEIWGKQFSTIDEVNKFCSRINSENPETDSMELFKFETK